MTAPAERFDTVIEGRASYDVGRAAGVRDAWPHLHHVVASRSDLGDVPVEVVADPVACVQRLKRADGLDLWLAGGGTLAHTLLPEIDRLVLKVNPVVLGSGVPLFDGPPATQRFAHVDQVDLPGGVRVLTLDREP